MINLSQLPSAAIWGQAITVSSIKRSLPVVTGPESWQIFLNPATTVQATASKAAGGAGFKHILVGFKAFYMAGASAITAAAPMTVNIRDGATGAGTILCAIPINVPATAAQMAAVASGDWLFWAGSANTAMTIEFAAGGGTNSYQQVMAWGYTVTV